MFYDDSERHKMNFTPSDKVVVKLIVEKNDEVVYETEGDTVVCALLKEGMLEAMVGPQIDIEIISAIMLQLNQEVLELLKHVIGEDESESNELNMFPIKVDMEKFKEN